MALIKEIVQEDGVITAYHRILYIQSTVNSHTSIAVLSYINKESRGAESADHTPYRAAKTYEIPYDEELNTVKAYEYMKKTEEFKGAMDDI